MEKLDLNKYERDENGRLDLSKTKSNVLLPDLCDIQLNSFNWFEKVGINEVFNDAFPISSDKDARGKKTISSDDASSVELSFVSAEWRERKHDFFQCKTSSLTYSRPLFVTFRLKKSDGTIDQDSIFMGDFPTISESGTFIINGSEKCIASQLVRSPGAYVSKDVAEIMPKKTETGANKETNTVYEADIIPQRGIWLEFFTDNRDILSVRIDKQKRIPALTLLRALGLLSDSDVLLDSAVDENGKSTSDAITSLIGLFGENKLLLEALDKAPLKPGRSTNRRREIAISEIFRKLKPGEIFNNDTACSLIRQRFFENEHYDLGRAGRFKIQEKLGIYERLTNQQLAEDLVDCDGTVAFEKGHTLTADEVKQLKQDHFFERKNGDSYCPHRIVISSNLSIAFDPDLLANGQVSKQEIDEESIVTLVRIYSPEEPDKIVNVIGTNLECEQSHVTIPDILASFSYLLNFSDGIGIEDDTDHLGNKRLRCVGELVQEKFRIGLAKMKKNIHDKMSTQDLTSATINSLVNPKPLSTAVNQFFNSDSLSQFMDQTNPLAELTNKRRISALGKGGLTRDRASSAVRDVHPTHYGRICPIETPEGQNIGLISNLACYATVNKYGFIETPYRRVENCIIDNDPTHVVYLTAAEEKNHIIAEAIVNVDPNTNEILDQSVKARKNGEYITAKREDVDFIDASPKQIVSIAAACIPFLENDDGKRALMGSNMQRQALPLLRPHTPYVGTGLEAKIAHDSGEALLALEDGKVLYADSCKISVLEENGMQRDYPLRKFMRSNKRTCINQTPIVDVGDQIKKGQIIADGSSMENAELALGQNVLVAFTTWHGYNYEDAVVISQRCVSDDLFTNLIIEEYTVQRRKTKLGEEDFTRTIPNVSEDRTAYLDERGIIVPGTEVKEGDILVGKTTPKGETSETNNDHLLKAIFLEKSGEEKDSSLRVPHGGEGIVLDVKRFSRRNGDELPSDVLESISVFVIQKRKIQVGDKMSGRHGNKGVISKVLPVEDMPYLPDGTPVDILLSPMGVPSRMNIGQVLEVQLGYACQKLGIKVSNPVFDGASNEEIAQFMELAGIDSDGKTILYDGQTGERFDSRIAVGVMYMIKLDHMVEDKIHARAIGPYSVVTQQPLGGKAQNGGQRFGEMEVWALEAYGAAYTLQEMLTIKSDDMIGRNKTYESILKGTRIPKPNMPESTRVLIKELQGLCLNVTLQDEKQNPIDMDTLAEDAEKSSRRIHRDLQTLDSKKTNSDDEYSPISAQVYVPQNQVDESKDSDEDL